MSTENAQQYFRKCLHEVRLSLDLDPVTKDSRFNQRTARKSGPDISLMILFQDACDGLLLRTPRGISRSFRVLDPTNGLLDQRERLFIEIELFMSSTLVERSMHRSHVIPQADHYLKLRLHAAGIYPILAILG